MTAKQRAPRNRTLTLSSDERRRLRRTITRRLDREAGSQQQRDVTICADVATVLPTIDDDSVDLVFADPPYNLTKTFNGTTHRRASNALYLDWLLTWLPEMHRILKPAGSIYVCSDWRSSSAVYDALDPIFTIRNRITWEREKGRGAKANWKNSSEDIWFATMSDEYHFDLDAVKLRRRVLAPYTTSQGRPKDWQETDSGRYRDTCPSNLWTDLTVPFWSMPENTDHPTQKPEKLLAKIILASTKPKALVFDPFAGSGTTQVVAKKLDRHFIGVDIDEDFCCLAQRRLELADNDPSIQGFHSGVFWERNSKPSP